MAKKAALYARVSTVDKDQNPEVQLTVLRKYCQDQGWEIFKEYVDKAKAVDYQRRTAWTQLMKEAAGRRFDTLLVWKLDRAFRSNIDAHNTLAVLRKYNVAFRCYSDPSLDTDTATGVFLFAILAALAEMEREQIRERVQAGMDYAKDNGTKSGLPIGRPRRLIEITNVCKALHMASGSYSEAARLLSKGTDQQVKAAFVFMRAKREAERINITLEDFVAGCRKGTITGENDGQART